VPGLEPVHGRDHREAPFAHGRPDDRFRAGEALRLGARIGLHRRVRGAAVGRQRAAARASNRTGRPIMAHSRPASETGLDQMRIFSDEGVDPGKVQIAHTGDTDDLDHIEELLQTGCWIGLDRFGIDLFLPDDRRMPTFIELVSRGYTDRILLGCHAVANLDWFPPELVAQLAPKWTHTHLFDEILPAAREAGVTDDQIRVMLEDNPKAWLTA
jgi:phosphotriesterase-related protein